MPSQSLESSDQETLVCADREPVVTITSELLNTLEPAPTDKSGICQLLESLEPVKLSEVTQPTIEPSESPVESQPKTAAEPPTLPRPSTWITESPTEKSEPSTSQETEPTGVVVVEQSAQTTLITADSVVQTVQVPLLG